jgi:hypothetical protein
MQQVDPGFNIERNISSQDMADFLQRRPQPPVTRERAALLKKGGMAKMGGLAAMPKKGKR